MGIDTVSHLTDADVKDLDVIRDHLVILGGIYISLEFAQIFRRFGAAVTVLEAFLTFLGRQDADIAAYIHGILTGEGIRIKAGITNLSFATADHGIAALSHRCGGRLRPDGQSLAGCHRAAAEYR